MIKLICIIDNNHYLYGNINKGSIVLTCGSFFNGNSFLDIYLNESYRSYIGTRNKTCFISLDKWRDIQINIILNND
jgi:hypothetical protein